MRIRIVLAEQPYRLVFAELVESLRFGLRELGHDVELATSTGHGARNLVVAPQLLLATDERPYLAPGDIVYNVEPPESLLFVRALRLLGRQEAVAWTYSSQSARALRAVGLAAEHVPCAFYPGLVRRQGPPRERDVDVLFFGSLNERRSKVLEDVAREGLRLKTLTNHFVADRDEWLLRSKVALNVHFYDGRQSLEDLRLLLACANGLAVVSEFGPDEPYKDDWARWAGYKNLADACVDLVRSGRWVEQAERGRAAVQRCDVVSILRAALETEKHP